MSDIQDDEKYKKKLFYSNYFGNLITKGNIIGIKKLPSGVLRSTFDKFITSEGYKKVWCIINIEPYYNGRLSNDVYMHMKMMVHNTDTIVNTISENLDIDINSNKFENAMMGADRQLQRYLAHAQKMSYTELRVGKFVKEEDGSRLFINQALIDNQQLKVDSFNYIREAEISGGGFTLTYVFIEGVCKSKRKLNSYTKELRSYLKSQELKFVELSVNMTYYLANMSPIGCYDEKLGSNGLCGMLIPKEELMNIIPTEIEGISESVGSYIAVNVFNRLPLYLNFNEGVTGQVNAIFMKTGHGKTFLCKTLSKQQEGLNDFISIMDYKGGEYSVDKKLGDVVEIKLRDSDGCYINTVEIMLLDNLTKQEKINMYIDCFEATKQLILTIANFNVEDEMDISSPLSDAMTILYESNGVFKEHPYTYENSKGMSLHMIMGILQDFMKSKTYTQHQINLLSKLCERLKPYLAFNGDKEHIFKNSVNLKEVIEAQVNIYDFGKNTQVETDLSIDDNLRIFMMMYANNIKIRYVKSIGGHTSIFMEELQRAIAERRLVRYINHLTTGGRSSNVTMFLIFNSANLFNNPEDQDLKGIITNITSWFIGYIETADIELISKYGTLNEIIPYIKKIAEDQETYHNCFAAKYDTGVTRGRGMFKVEVPVSMAKSEFYVTREVTNYE